MSDEPDNEAPLDPSIWRPTVVASAPERLGLPSAEFFAASESATNPTHKAVLRTLGTACSAALNANSWNEPFTPIATWSDGSRSWLPDDLNDEQKALLVRVAAALDDHDDRALRARAYDVCWTYIDRSDPAMLAAAIDAYRAAPLEPDAWAADSSDAWRRAFELVSRRRDDNGREQAAEMSAAVLDRLRRVAADDAGFGVQLSHFARQQRLVGRGDRADFADLAVARAADARTSSDWSLAQGWEQEAAAWHQAAGNNDDACRARVRLAGDLVSEAAARRLSAGGAANTAGHLVEQALAVLRKLPRHFRSDHAVDEFIADLDAQLTRARQAILNSMAPVRGGTVDLADEAAAARQSVSGHDPVSALIALAVLAPFNDPDRAEATARADIERNPVPHMISREKFRGTGQKVASTPGRRLREEDGDTGQVNPGLWATMIRNQLICVRMRVAGFIVPAIDVVTAEHRYPTDLLYGLCYMSPAVPAGHERLWAMGLRHGLDGDYASALGRVSQV